MSHKTRKNVQFDVDSLSKLERLLFSQAVYELGSEAWPEVVKLLSEHPLIHRPKGFFTTQSCLTIYHFLVEQCGLELVKSDAKKKSAGHLMLARGNYGARVIELKGLIAAEEEKFKALAAEIDEIRSGKWDHRIMVDLGLKSPDQEEEAHSLIEELAVAVETVEQDAEESQDAHLEVSAVETVIQPEEPVEETEERAESPLAEAEPQEQELQLLDYPSSPPIADGVEEGEEPVPMDVETEEATVEDVVAPDVDEEEVVPPPEEQPLQSSEPVIEDVDVVPDETEESDHVPDVPQHTEEDIESHAAPAPSPPPPPPPLPFEEHVEEPQEDVIVDSQDSNAIVDTEPEEVLAETTQEEDAQELDEDMTEEDLPEPQQVDVDAEVDVDVDVEGEGEVEPETVDAEPVIDAVSEEEQAQAQEQEQLPEENIEVDQETTKADTDIDVDVESKEETDHATQPEVEVEVEVEAMAASEKAESVAEVEATTSTRSEGKRKMSDADTIDGQRERKRAREESEPAEEEEPGPATSRSRRKSQAPTEGLAVSKKFQNVIGMLHGTISQHRYGNIFHNPIKKSEAPDYADIVKRPMDLKSIKMRVKEGVISNSLEFQRDIYLMFANAMMYNRPGSEIYNMAEEMMLESERHINTFRQTEGFHRN